MSIHLERNTSEKYCCQFLQGDNVVLPDDQESLNAATIAEAIRLALASDFRGSTGTEEQIHVLSLRSWAVNKLASLLGEPDTESNSPDWFRKVLTDGRGPTLVFLGELLELAQGYYAPAPTRAVMITSSEAILISSNPTAYFTTLGLTIRHCGVPRHVVDTSADELKEAGLPIQAQEDYVRLNPARPYNEEFFKKWRDTTEISDWNPNVDREAYYTKRYDFGWGESATTALIAGEVWSLHCDTTEYGMRDYWWRIQDSTERDSSIELKVPNRYWKQFALFLDSASGDRRIVKIVENDTEVAIQCPFKPPAAQVRWLHAIGANFDGFVDHGLQWRFSSEHTDATIDVFSGLEAEITQQR